MVLLLNGAFGIGKTTVARAAHRKIPSSAVFDPERIGWVLQRLPSWIPLDGRGTGDFQDLAMWRAWTVRGIHATRLLRKNVIVPMAFSNPRYLSEIREQVLRFDANVQHLCLAAPIEVVHERLSRRGATPTANPWEFRRARECCEAHAGSDFAERVDTADRAVDEIVEDVVARVRANSRTCW